MIWVGQFLSCKGFRRRGSGNVLWVFCVNGSGMGWKIWIWTGYEHEIMIPRLRLYVFWYEHLYLWIVCGMHMIYIYMRVFLWGRGIFWEVVLVFSADGWTPMMLFHKAPRYVRVLEWLI